MFPEQTPQPSVSQARPALAGRDPNKPRATRTEIMRLVQKMSAAFQQAGISVECRPDFWTRAPRP